MNEYEKYRLQWMLDHDYSLPDLLERLSDIAMNENLDEIQNPRVMLNEAFERLEYEQGFDNKEIWLCKDEWEHDLYSSNEYSLTDAGKTKVNKAGQYFKSRTGHRKRNYTTKCRRYSMQC